MLEDLEQHPAFRALVAQVGLKRAREMAREYEQAERADELGATSRWDETAYGASEARQRQLSKREQGRVRERWRPPAGTKQIEGSFFLGAPRNLPPVTGRREPTPVERWMAAQIRMHLGQVDCQMYDKLAAELRSAYVAFSGAPPEDYWREVLREAFRSALAFQQAKPRYRMHPAPNGRKLKVRMIVRHPDGTPVNSGRGILKTLGWACPPGILPPELTAPMIDRALRRATLGRGGGRGKEALANWQIVLSKLLAEEEAKR
jgi:hypothetical protein